jgi:hypothetical protein
MNAAADTAQQPRAPGPTLAAFESLAFEVDAFDHEAHVYVAWLYVRDFELPDAISRYCDTLRRLTSMIGIPGKYHETITWFFMILVAERVRRDPARSWEAFRQSNPDLFRQRPGIIRHYYSDERLGSQEARRHFLLPDIRTAGRHP